MSNKRFRLNAGLIAAILLTIVVSTASAQTVCEPGSACISPTTIIEYKCYTEAQGPAINIPGVGLSTPTEPFPDETVTVQQPLFVCSPAVKTVPGLVS